MQLKGQAIGFKGEYAVTILDKHGNKKEYINKEQTIRSGEPIKNALLDTFFELLSTTSNSLSMAYIRCGSGAGAVENTQTALEQQLSLNSGGWPRDGSSTLNTELEGGTVKMAQRHTFTFGLGQIAGNISELGVQFLSSGSLHSRALVEDSQGQPTTITVTSDEQLIITYTIRAEASTDDVVQTVPMMINGEATNTEVTCRWNPLSSVRIATLLADFLPKIGYGDFNDSFELPSFRGSTHISNYSRTQIAGGRRFTVTLSASQANYTRMLEIMQTYYINDIACSKFQFVPPIPKSSDRTLSLSIDCIFGRI